MATSAIINILNTKLTRKHREKNFRLNLFGRITGTAVGYNATLQGGLFNKSSPYTISSQGLERFVGQYRFGISLQLKSVNLEYYRAFISREFKTGTPEAWGGIRLGLGL